MKIRQFFYGSDNLAYLLCSNREAMAIDGGAVDAIMDYVRAHDLTLKRVTNTHNHGDHTTGTRRLVERSGADYLDHRQFADGETIDLDGRAVTVRRTPGHTMDSVTFVAGGVMVTGDTLFNGTVGNCFSGDLRAFYDSIRRLMAYPATTRIYAGHDYVAASLAFARHLTPHNHAIDAYAARYDNTHVVSTLADEMAVNPYLRFNDPEMIALLESRGLPTGDEYQRWEGIMSLE
ncbi:MBL fold metallo-hydrolase [Desulfosarcina ovata]|uniref:hydroxyacylglutathione hydrolase n=2 Tax=Desulfosarcina ovata TaxID=83564 RepID=A0A5K8AG60_9BACT|nr:MBL fold metallo-hydrolase [Desulfosarcina ovata]BBO82963.1 hydroxyacylglutathione hydrolase [Desulfosarcina ovata subsp. sediminis]BBO91627.1 hydroxyacylglutathione hydrolase [Desulfosarcina ovata subsp. ovata]